MKILVSFLILQFVCIASLLLLARRPGGRNGMFAMLFLLCVLLYGVSTPWGAELLHRSLEREWVWDPARDSIDPEVIVVLGGGLQFATNPGEDVLAPHSALRVVRAVRLADRFPDASVIFTGGSSHPRQGPGMAERMARYATGWGLAASRCRIEPNARNTREHSDRVLEMPEIEPTTRLLVVTSDFHLPRTRIEFDRVFSSVAYAGAGTRPSEHPPWTRFLPQEDALSASTNCLREWIGLLWYRVHRAEPE